MISFARTNELYLELPYEDLNANPKASSLDQKTISKESRPDEVNYWVKDNELWVDIHVASSLDQLGSLNIEIFSYKNGIEFSTMPKLNLKLLGNHIFVRDGHRLVSGSGVQYDLGNKILLIKIPLDLLTLPDYIFVSAQTLQNDITLDFGSWKILKVNKTGS